MFGTTNIQQLPGPLKLQSNGYVKNSVKEVILLKQLKHTDINLLYDFSFFIYAVTLLRIYVPVISLMIL